MLGKAVLHVSLSAAPGESMSAELWDADRPALPMRHGTGKQPHVVNCHIDIEHPHVPPLVSLTASIVALPRKAMTIEVRSC